MSHGNACLASIFYQIPLIAKNGQIDIQKTETKYTNESINIFKGATLNQHKMFSKPKDIFYVITNCIFKSFNLNLLTY